MTARSVSVRKQNVSREVRDQVVLDHLPLAKAIAIRVHENLPVHVELDDLIHAGVLGLFDAVEKYDANKNVEFQSYAKHRIKGAILDSLRQADWASRDMRRRQKKVDAMSRDFTAKFGRTPTENEIASELGVSTDRWRRMALELRNVGLVSTTPREDLDNALRKGVPSRFRRPARSHLRTAPVEVHPRPRHRQAARALPESRLSLLHQPAHHERDRRHARRQRKPHLADSQAGIEKDGRGAAIGRHRFGERAY